MSANDSEAISLATPSAIHVGPIVTPGSNETISIVIPLSAQLTTVTNEGNEKPCKESRAPTSARTSGSATPAMTTATTTINPTWRWGNPTKGCPFPTCTRYGRAFSRAHDLKRHMARHEMRKERLSEVVKVEVHSCTDCGANFMSEAVLRKHSQTHARPGSAEDSSVDARPYPCRICKKKYTHESKLKAHLSIHDKQRAAHKWCALCGVRFDKDEQLLDHVKAHVVNAQQAQAASEKSGATTTTTTTTTATTVQVKREEEADFNLEEMLLLNKTSRAPGSAKANSAKPDAEKIRCDYCSKTFKTKWTLGSHVAAHEGRYQYDCKQCGKKFVRKSHFEGHVRSHEAARPYVCDQCGKTFKELKHRREHTKRKHPGNHNAIQNLLDSISACVSEESSVEQAKFTLLMPMDFSV
ncbi:zinc finger protein 502 isoform X2 [Orussus abietinus]|nr:zinc finger protein 502 isoform X2 [Orussus abietinus]XP_012283939.1 zinc finger protein 502 isoform X2 [Orussus abietinus]